jgi:hypothetical protein
MGTTNLNKKEKTVTRKNLTEAPVAVKGQVDLRSLARGKSNAWLYSG